MGSTTSPGIVFASRFVTANSSKKFGTYIQYMDRDEAVRTHEYNNYNFIRPKDFGNYNHYMRNPEKSSGLFSANKDGFLSKNEIHQLQQKFIEAQENDSCMWQDVISFNNQFLEKYGLYEPENQLLNEQKIMDSTRIAMKNILEKEGMSATGIWTASIHYNTDNIHVHVALVEPKPTKPYYFDKKKNELTNNRVGYRRKPNVLKFKSDFVNHMIDRSLELQKISKLVREDISGKDNQDIFRQKKNELLWRKIYNELPRTENGYRVWKYNMNILNEVRPKINQFIDQYLENEKSYEMQALKKLLDEEDNFRKEVYGESIANQFSDDPENNIENFSKNNQKKIKEVVSDATLVHQKEVWESMGYTVKEDAQPIYISVPVKNDNAENGILSFDSKIAFDVSQLNTSQSNPKLIKEGRQMNELRTRLGNQLLRTMVEHDKEINQARSFLTGNNKKSDFKKAQNKITKKSINRFGNRVQYEQRKQSRKNMRDYEMLSQIEDELKDWSL